jgi:hypothetical protein
VPVRRLRAPVIAKRGVEWWVDGGCDMLINGNGA